MKHFIVYEGRNVALAAMQREYIDALMPWINDPAVTEGLLIDPPLTLEFEQQWYDGLHKQMGAAIVFAILYRKTKKSAWRYIGHTNLHKINWKDSLATSGTIIGDRSLHGKGVGTEAKLLLLHHAFHTMGLYKVCSEVKAFNGNSFGHLLRCGYGVSGRQLRHRFHQSGRVDQILLEVFREDFEPIWKQYQETGELPKLADEQRALIKKESEST